MEYIQKQKRVWLTLKTFTKAEKSFYHYAGYLYGSKETLNQHGSVTQSTGAGANVKASYNRHKRGAAKV